MIDTTLIGVISASTALVASVAGPIVALYVARVQIKAAVRSANRQKWIEEIRELISSFCAQTATSTQIHRKVFKDGRVNVAAEPEILHHFERLIFTATKIRLMVNPLDQEHRTLIEAVDGLLLLFRTATGDVQDEAQTRAKQLIAMSLQIIRDEWLRVQGGK